jgi:hypothetical protein
MTPRRLDRSARAWALLLAMSGCALEDGSSGSGFLSPASAMMRSSSQTETTPSH